MGAPYFFAPSIAQDGTDVCRKSSARLSVSLITVTEPEHPRMSSIDALDRHERLQVLLRTCGRLAAERDAALSWIGRSLLSMLEDGRSFKAAFKIAPRKGSKSTAKALLQRQRADRLLRRLSVICGSDRAAVLVLAGSASIPAEALDLVAELKQLNVGVSAVSFARMRRRSVTQEMMT